MKIRDRVYHKKYGYGTVVRIEKDNYWGLLHLVDFDQADIRLHDGNSYFYCHPRHCWWCFPEEFEKVIQPNSIEYYLDERRRHLRRERKW